ncbi:MAG: transcription elongation factor GreA [Pseudomonadota bacterium]|nr:transcription elongation factor GreA [Pseudomonadota bacterium]QKK05974.1 MAG: transcription elongation factor GreA [Pseudomonadota bacterium]|tara:strand:- start:77 stop:550 length:474 start_codon:yes stop_codon:yes gene_type:complete
MDKMPITTTGYQQLEAELKRLKSEERPAIIEAISAAREHGDLSENAEYHSAREKQSFIEGRIADLEDKMARAEIIDPKKIAGDTVKFSATIHVVDEDTEEELTYQIVGEYEADIDKNMLSLSAPLSRALIGKRVGDSVEVTTPKGSKAYEILGISYQ